MSTPTPTGTLRWGQSGRYTAFDDRVVITALAGGRTGVIQPARMTPAGGLTISVSGGWLAIADAGDGTSCVVGSRLATEVDAAPGDVGERTDELWAEIADPETATWVLSLLPAGGSRGGVLLGWVHVPPGATSSAEMTLISREQDFSTGGAIPGPPGPIGPPGPSGPQGTATLIVGSFGDTRTPDELPDDGRVPAHWDGFGRPANDLQIEQGWAFVYTPTGELWNYVGQGFAAAWLNIGLVRGPQGDPGPPGPPGQS